MKAQERKGTWLHPFLTWTLTRDNIIAALYALLTYSKEQSPSWEAKQVSS